MRLKSIELFGFKSFPDHTTIEFEDGVTAILGPNGCGKSNVVDAIKWVLGEKSAKSLRGDEMLDVIFSGCESRAASGMAEVKLNFDNSDQSFPLPYNEVCIGRRLNRARESEYFVNKKPCRLKYIRELLSDAGVGTSAYSVIEQGRVEALLHAKPADRRAVFEEAAGIAKFKIKRKEILSRLERTSQILLRVGDRMEEKDRQIKRVSAQAANARRHRKLTNERDAIRTHFYKRQFAEQSRLLDDCKKRREALESELDNENRALAALADELLKASNAEAELSAHRDAVVEAATATQEELSGILLDQANARSRIEALANEMNLGNQRRAELSARLERLSLQEADVKTRLDEAERLAADLDERFARQDQSRRDMLLAASEAESAVTALRNRAIDLNRRRQETASAVARLEASEQSSGQRLAELDARLNRIKAEEDELTRGVQSLEEEYGKAAEGFGAEADRLEGMRGRQRELSTEMERLRASERAGEAERAAMASRKATLEDLEASFDGAFEGVRNVLLAARGGERDCRGVVGMALDLMTVPQDLALAVETILGGSAQDVVVESARDAQGAIEYLKRNRLGRATFLPLDRIQPRRRLVQSFKHIPGVIGEAVELVAFDPRHRSVMDYLLAGILVVDNLDLARELAGREARGVKIVTLEGDVVSPSGAMTGGHGRQRRSGLVQRKAELDALARELAACESRLAERSRRGNEAAAQLRDIEERISALQNALAEAGRSEAQLKQNLAVRRSELDRLVRDRTDTQSERDRIAFGGDGKREELEFLRQALDETIREMSGLEEEVAARTEEQRRTRAAIDTLGQDFATLSGERSAAVAKVRELGAKRVEVLSEQELAREELAKPGISSVEAEAEMSLHRGKLEELKGREADLLRLRDERKAAGAELAERLMECRARAEGFRQRERESQAQVNRIREGLSQIDRQAAECDFRIANIRDKAREELQLDNLAPAAPAREEAAWVGEDGGLPPPLPVAEAAEPEEAPEWASWSDSEIQSKLEELAQKLRNIGNVNPEAIDELAELEASAAFMRSHKDELEEAVATMRSAIEQLNEESSTRFQETFAAVQANFQELFTKLFGGGKAELFLEEVTEPGADPLDAGIDIRAQPPGKEPKSISLLSGGEKALCAVALLFALFRSKPSPFCILDEVDGPLDESNIDRFMQQVKEFTDETQFIIISHSQRTMSMTDRIWGVTQKVPGISFVYSLAFKAMERISAETPPASRGGEVRGELREEMAASSA